MGLISSLKKAFSKPYKTVSVAEAKELLSSGATLIDVRSAEEWRTGRAVQAKHVPLDRLQTSAAGIQKTRPGSRCAPPGSARPQQPGSSLPRASTPTPSAAAWAPGARPTNPSANHTTGF